MNNQDDMIIKSALRSHLSGLHLSLQGQRELKNRIQGGEQVKKRIPVALVLAMALILVTLTALAVNSLVEQHARDVMEIGENYGLLRWDLNDKIAFVDAMERAELPMDQAMLKKLRDGGTPDSEKEKLADSLIDARYGELLEEYRKELAGEDFDLPKAPDAYLVFMEAYLREHPGATLDEARAAFDDFLSGYYKAETLTEEEWEKEKAARKTRIATEADILESMSGNLTEIGMGLDAWEATKARITATFNKEHQVWVATATIRAQDIDADRRKWIADEVDGMLKGIVQLKDEVFTATYLFDVHGQGIWEVHSLAEYIQSKTK